MKYLYLLFDDSPAPRLSNDVFSTEGQKLSLPSDLQVPASPVHRALRQGENQLCPAYDPPTVGGGLVVGIEGRSDYDYAASLVFGPGGQGIGQETAGSTEFLGMCVVPQVPRYVGQQHISNVLRSYLIKCQSFEIHLSSANSSDPDDLPPADLSPSKEKVYRDDVGSYVIADSTGLRLGVRWRLDAKGYDVTNSRSAFQWIHDFT